MKRVISLILMSVLLIVGTVPVMANAEQKIFYYSDTGSFNAVVQADGTAKLTGNINKTDTLSKVIVPKTIEGHTVSAIGNLSLAYLNASEIELPSTITYIEESAVRGSMIKEFIVPPAVTFIGNNAFYGCTKLTDITLSESLKEIGTWAFANCALKSLVIPDSVTTIGENAFYNVPLTSVKFGTGLKTIGDGAFLNARMASVVIPVNVSYIGIAAFASETIKTVKIYNKNCIFNGDAVFRNKNGSYVYIYSYGGGTVQAFANKGIYNYIFKYLNPTVKSIKLTSTSFTYDGKLKMPKIIAVDTNGATISNKYYTVAYGTNKYVGTAKAVVKFKGAYSGTKTLYFNILPKGTKLTKLVAGKKCFAAKWAKQAVQTNGYQIQYALTAKFTGAKTVTVKSNAKTAYTIKSLAAKRVYYARIRTYKVVGGKVYASPWSAVAKVKTK